MAVPEDAERSDDGRWWDGEQWQAVPEDEVTGGASGGAPDDGVGADGEAAEYGTGWPPHGLSEDPVQWSAEQQQYYFGGLEEDFYSWVEEGDSQEVAVAEISDSDEVEA